MYKWFLTLITQLFCRHVFNVEALPPTMGVFAGLLQYTCVKCGYEKIVGVKDRLKRNGLL